MPHINTSSTNSNYTTINLFQEAIDANAISFTSYTTDLGHLALTRKLAEFKAANGDTSFVIPTHPGDVLTPPLRISTRVSAAALAIDASAIAETTDPYQAHESQ